MSTSSDESRITENIKQLAEAVSIQTKVANRAWLTTMVVSILVLFPPVNANKPEEIVTLPFQIATVDATLFYPVVFALLSVLIVAFASAQAQAVRAQNLAQLALSKISISAIFGIHPKDYFDMVRTASVNRVAPLAQLLRGKYQFWDSANSCPTWRKIFTSIYYLFLKIIAAIVYWLLPSFAYWQAYNIVSDSQVLPYWTIILLAVIGASSLIVVAFSDLQYVLNTFSILLRTLKKEKD